jgi:hypothetical protein
MIKTGRGEEIHNQGLVAQWITRLTTDQKIPGSNPGKVGFFKSFFTSILAKKKNYGQCGDRTRDLRVISTTL